MTINKTTNTQAHTQAHIHIHAHTHMNTHTHTHTCMNSHMHASTHTPTSPFRGNLYKCHTDYIYHIYVCFILDEEKLGKKGDPKRDISVSPWEGEIDKISEDNWEWRRKYRRERRGEGQEEEEHKGKKWSR